MPLNLTLRELPDVPIEVPDVLPERLVGATRREIELTSIQVGNRPSELGAHFVASGTVGNELTIRWSGDLGMVHRIGESISRGTIHVEGNAGDYLACRATGGEIVVAGNAGNWIGMEMSGGRVRVDGNAGDCIGSARPGAIRGMTGGAIVVRGNARSQVGDSMRGGLIGIGGKCQQYVGMNMLAGSIVVAGDLGRQPGVSMRRGTIITLSKLADVPLAFQPGWKGDAIAIFLTLKWAERLSLGVMPNHAGWIGRWYHGDRLEGGRGELVEVLSR